MVDQGAQPTPLNLKVVQPVPGSSYAYNNAGQGAAVIDSYFSQQHDEEEVGDEEDEDADEDEKDLICMSLNTSMSPG